MGDVFCFDSKHAELYGTNEAVILYNIIFWIKKNKANNKHFYDRKHWTYNSVKAFNELFSFLSKPQIRRVLENLEKEKAIITGNYNKLSYDRTTWYTLSDELYIKHIDNNHLLNSANGFVENSKSICQIQQMDLSKLANGFDENSKPIPDINTDVISDINTHKLKSLCVEIEKMLGEKISQKTVNDLIKQSDSETISYYIANWDKYRNHAKKGQAAYFIYCVQNNVPLPSSKQSKQSHTNFDQREYQEDEFEKYYANGRRDVY